MAKELIEKFFYYEINYTMQSYGDIKNQRETAELGIFRAGAPMVELQISLIARSDKEARNTFIEWIVKKHYNTGEYPESYVNLVKRRFDEQGGIAMPPNSFYRIQEMTKHKLKEFPIPKGLILKIFSK